MRKRSGRQHPGTAIQLQQNICPAIQSPEEADRELEGRPCQDTNKWIPDHSCRPENGNYFNAVFVF